MSTPAEGRLGRRVLRHELEAIRAHWVWFLILGIVLIVVGMIAVGMPFVASVATAVTFARCCSWEELPSSSAHSGRAIGAGSF